MFLSVAVLLVRLLPKTYALRVTKAILKVSCVDTTTVKSKIAARRFCFAAKVSTKGCFL